VIVTACAERHHAHEAENWSLAPMVATVCSDRAAALFSQLFTAVEARTVQPMPFCCCESCCSIAAAS